jgi:O-antigen/teichoic acid export membrane protein
MPKLIKVTNKDVIWNYLGYGITFGINIILLPLVLRYLTSTELGLWYVFSSIGVLITLFDFGFAPQVARTITYAFAGASKLTKTGINQNINNNAPNYELLRNLISSSKLLYFIIAIISLILLLTIGSVYINFINKNDFNNTILLAWIIYCLGCFINLAYSFYNSIFRGIGKFVSLNKAIVFSRSTQFIFSFVLLLLDFGILAVTIGYTVNTLVFRLYLAYIYKKQNIFGTTIDSDTIKFSERIQLLKIIWHNAARDGLVTISSYLVLQSNTILCSLYFGLEKTASYALSVQIITFIASFSTIVYGTIQPVLVEASLTNNIAVKKQYYSMSWTIFFFSYLIVVSLFVLFGVPLLTLIKSNTRIELGIFLLYAVYVFLQTNSTLSASYISTSNKLPYALPFIISAITAVVLAIIFAKFTSLGVIGLILAHLFVQLLYNMWKWPMLVFQELKTNPWHMFQDTFTLIKKKYLVKGSL